MWFWLMLILVGVGIGVIILGKWMYDNTKYDTSWLYETGWGIAIIAGIVAVIMAFVIIDSHTNIEAKTAENQQRYNSLVYQLENNLYDNDNDLGKKELYEDIEGWNKNLAYYQKAQDDLWMGIFYPNIYDQFKFIKYQ